MNENPLKHAANLFKHSANLFKHSANEVAQTVVTLGRLVAERYFASRPTDPAGKTFTTEVDVLGHKLTIELSGLDGSLSREAVESLATSQIFRKYVSACRLSVLLNPTDVTK